MSLHVWVHGATGHQCSRCGITKALVDPTSECSGGPSLVTIGYGGRTLEVEQETFFNVLADAQACQTDRAEYIKEYPAEYDDWDHEGMAKTVATTESIFGLIRAEGER